MKCFAQRKCCHCNEFYLPDRRNLHHQRYCSKPSWEQHPYSATQIFQRLRAEEAYTGGISILTDYVRRVRPVRAPAFLTLVFAPGECAQVDWGCAGSMAIGSTRRRLSFFVMVLCYSRFCYVEFTLGEAVEHFLAWPLTRMPWSSLAEFRPKFSSTILRPLCSSIPLEKGQFLSQSSWDEAAVAREYRATMAEALADPDGVFLVDDATFPKAGQHSVGVQRQH
jgi:DDE superfamily endonuclease